MLMTTRKPIGVGEILVEEFMEPLGLWQTRLAQITGPPRKHINELCGGRRAVTADTGADPCAGVWQLSGVLAEHTAGGVKLLQNYREGYLSGWKS